MSTVGVRARGTYTSSTTVVTTPTTTAVRRPRALSIGLIASSVPLPLSPTLPAFTPLPPLALPLPTQEEDGISKHGTDRQTDCDIPPLLRLPSELLLQIIRLLYTPSPSSPSLIIPTPLPNKPNYKSSSSNKEPSVNPAFFALARTCTHLLDHVRDVLYEKVVLWSVKDLARFRRSLIPIYSYGYGRGVRGSGNGSGMGTSVRQLAITCDTDAAYAYRNTSALIDAEAILGNANVVRHLRKLVVPSPFELRFLPPAEGGIEQVFVRSVNAVTHSSGSSRSGNRVYPPLLRDTTHFCVAEPSTRGWVSPCEILDSVFPSPSPSPSPAFTPVTSQYKLTHLHFARRADANAENDVAFVKDVRDIITSNSDLQSRFPALESVVISVFAPEWMDNFAAPSHFDEGDRDVGSMDVVAEVEEKQDKEQGDGEEDSPYEQCAKASHLWCLLDELRSSLPSSSAKLLIRVGRSDEWAEEWQTHPSTKNRKGLGFWERCIAEERARERRILGY